ncbi:O-antigen ligase family protein [Adhaeribacter swui]|uniref:O-antigen ligase family protein n=1 Tax=Adhaeribacter swui TaxID=2086471 RepID=A0A7G7GCV9_9BACT|nr:O-antigen ligase family protein [Adhaeribacter swui]QNF34993.1 O-antigen ligase family protein [Adhaeribacter swui]
MCFLNFLKGGDFSVVEKVLVKRIPLLIFPLVIGLSPKIQRKNLNAVLITFVISTIAASVVTYFRGVSSFVITPEALTDLAFKVIIHRPYFGLFCAFGILALLFLLHKKINIFLNLLIIVSAAYLLFFIVFIYAKMALVGLFVTAAFLVLLALIYRKYYTYLMILVVTCIVSFVMLYHVNAKVQRYTQSAIINTQNIIQGKGFSYEKYNILIVGSINVRYINWGCAFTILKANYQWVSGVGAGNAQKNLQNCYKDRNTWVYDNRMNAHNQFIQETLYTGIFGLLLFLSSLLVPGVMAYKKNNFLFIAFILIFIFCSLTENILERQIGIFFYAFFNSLLFFNSGQRDSTNIVS